MTVKKNKQLTFEEGIRQIEIITETLNSGSLTLEESMKAYETGIQLSKKLRDELDGLQKRIEQINPETGEVSEFEDMTYDV